MYLLVVCLYCTINQKCTEMRFVTIMSCTVSWSTGDTVHVIIAHVLKHYCTDVK